ncbi:MAG TPA: FAD-linked oxidase C-terminal domain-containing protein, partial [Candidatus Binataceae bacterium]|nr:FAD-linked oxidase C-terminal domain-containing protein [Candidatus Binataceae bacterium]
DSLERELRRAIDGEVRFDPAARALYSTDASNYRLVPLGVVIPRHEGDVIAAVTLARENRIPILPRGGGTSLAGQTCNSAMVLDFSKYMHAIGEIDVERRLVTVQPGAVQSQLNASLLRHDLFFAPDPATKDRCNIGGMIGNNSCGAHSVAYGKTVDNVESLDVLLYDGTRLNLDGVSDESAVGRVGGLYQRLRELRDRYGDLIRQRYPRIPRRVSGYNLDQLLPENGFNLARALVGSEGTLAITLNATLRLVPRPKRRALCVLGFRDIFVAADQSPWILEHRPDALEAFDHRLAEFCRITGMHKDLLRLLPEGNSFLVIELGGETAEEARGRAEALCDQARRVADCIGVRLMLDESEQRGIWTLRESGLGASAAIPGYPRTWPGAEDVAVAPAKLGAYLRRFAALLDAHKLEAAVYYGHFGDGCVHCRINFDLESAAGVQRFRASMEQIADLVVEFGGSLSGEHGDGRARSEFLPRTFGPELIEAFAEFKRAFDPDAMMNPGVIVRPDAIDSHLRLSPDRKLPSPATHFDFSDDGGFAGAALRCVGIGKCRKLDAGTMCPSYMATREEEHSTRGRAHLLFEALSGELLSGGMASESVREALDLCLSCKGCKRECPAGVDLAMYKAEFLAHYYQANRRPLRDRIFGRIHDYARLGALAPRLTNVLSASSATSSIVKQILNVHRERTLPRLAKRSFRSWFLDRRSQNHNGREVLLFPDTFNNFFQPEVAIAAVEVLERAGFRVTIPPVDLCCGRPLYDVGMLDLAKHRLTQILDALTPFVERNISLVGLEPSCILTFRDELPRLMPRDPRAKALANRAMLLDEFLVRDAKDFVPPAIARRALLHGHCHQKAIAGLGSELKILREMGGLALTELDAGCCGMAGAFGYDREHFDVSRKIGERVLLPAVRSSDPDTLIIADGFSCRSQIAQFCPGRRPMHLAQLLNLR